MNAAENRYYWHGSKFYPSHATALIAKKSSENKKRAGILKFRMTDISYNLLLSALLFFTFPLVAGYVAVKYRLSPLIGYIAGGVLLNVLLGQILPQSFVTNFSMFGLVLLVFTIGLETNLGTIRRFGRFVLLGGTLQIALSGIVIMILSLFFNFSLVESLFFGFAFALSSTAIVSKIIQENGIENSLLGGLATGVLILQDLAFIPLLIIFSSFGNHPTTIDLLQAIFFNSLKATLVLAIVYYVGLQIVPLIFNRIAKISREILNLLIIVFILASLTLFSFFGLSSLLAAFMAGVLVGQTLEHYHIFSEIRPLRDLLLIVFFVFLGLTVRPGFIVSHFIPIVLFTVAVILIKMVIVLLIYLAFRFHSRTSFSLSVFLFQIGEDAFILIYQGLLLGVIRPDSYYFAITVVLLTLFLTPILIHEKDKAYGVIRTFSKKYIPFLENFIAYRLDRDVPNIDVLPLKNHIVLCGYGRVGRYIGQVLMSANIPFIAVDYNFHVVENAKKQGVTIMYGDPTEIDVLDYAQCDTASILISAVPERFSQEQIIFNARKLNPKIIIFSRVHREADHIRMKDLGVEVVIQPEFEASLSIIRRVLHYKGLSREVIASEIKRLKAEHGMI